MSSTMGMAVAAGVIIAAVTCGLGGGLRAPEPIRRERVVLQRAESGAEGTVWRAQSTLPLASGAWVTIDEEVVLDDDDALVRAFTHVRDGADETTTWYEPRAGSVTTERGAVVARKRIPTDERWVYGPVRAPGGEPVGTPLAAWVTYRASTHASCVRVVGPEGSDLVPVDQLVVATERGEVVLLGDDAVDVDTTFVSSVHRRATRTTLLRVAPFGTEVRFARGA